MEIQKLIDTYGDDIYALALIITKDFNAAKQIFAAVTSQYNDFRDGVSLAELAKLTYEASEDIERNESAEVLTELELSPRLEKLLGEVIQRPQAIRTAIHLFYENDLDIKQISVVLGESERYIKGIISELDADFAEALEADYKVICTKITAGDLLKSYVIISSTKKDGRMFEAKGDAVPRHTWSKTQKIAVIAAACILSVAVLIVMPIVKSYTEMLERESEMDFEEAETSEIFHREDETPDLQKPQTLIEQIIDMFC
ncbi:MAG: hypothetical protein ACI4KM_06760 [Oscillospiraceae bacterium]